MFQHIPLAVIVSPPSYVTFPPHVAEESVISLTDAVTTLGTPVIVVKSLSPP